MWSRRSAIGALSGAFLMSLLLAASAPLSRAIYTCDGSTVKLSEVWRVDARSDGTLCLTRPTTPEPTPTPTPIPVPTPLPSGGSHEPTGMALITDRPFNMIGTCNTSNQCSGEGWDWYGASQPTLASDASAQKSPPNVARITYAQGFSGGSGQGQVCKGALGKRTIYVSAWVQLSSGFEGHPTGANKLFYIAANNNQTFVVPEADGVGGGALRPRFVIQNLAAPYADQNGTSATTIGRLQNTSSGVQIVRGKWTRFEYLLTLNTPGSANGSIDEWQDGVQTFSIPGLTFLPAGSSFTTWESVCWQPIWGGAGGTVVTTFWMQLDHVYISGK